MQDVHENLVPSEEETWYFLQRYDDLGFQEALKLHRNKFKDDETLIVSLLFLMAFASIRKINPSEELLSNKEELYSVVKRNILGPSFVRVQVHQAYEQLAAMFEHEDWKRVVLMQVHMLLYVSKISEVGNFLNILGNSEKYPLPKKNPLYSI